jgi:hypothetical protein
MIDSVEPDRWIPVPASPSCRSGEASEPAWFPGAVHVMAKPTGAICKLA